MLVSMSALALPWPWQLGWQRGSTAVAVQLWWHHLSLVVRAVVIDVTSWLCGDASTATATLDLSYAGVH